MRAVRVRKGASLLLINSETPLRDALRISLQQRGHLVYATNGLTDAVTALQQTKVDIILLDVHMPGTESQQLCRTLHQYSRAPIIVVSAADRPEDIARAYSSGADAYICKPFRLREVEQHIELALQRALQPI